MFFAKKIGQQENPPELGNYNPGDIDPTTGREIIYIVYQTSKFMVSIDKDISLNWTADETMQYADAFGDIVSKVSLAEALVDRIFQEDEDRLRYKKMLGDILGRELDDGCSTSAGPMLEETVSRVKAHAQEQVRMSYIKSAVWTVVLVGIIVILTVYWRKQLAEAFHQPEIVRVFICALLGGVGAFITTFARFQNYRGSIVAGLGIHQLDGFLRVFYGLVAGLFISLAIKGNVLAGFAGSGTQPWILYFMAMVAGASEVLVPNLVRQAENQTNLRNGDAEQPEGGEGESKDGEDGGGKGGDGKKGDGKNGDGKDGDGKSGEPAAPDSPPSPPADSVLGRKPGTIPASPPEGANE